MSIYDEIVADHVHARREKNSVILTILSTLIGEIQRSPSKDVSDKYVISVIKKIVDANLQTGNNQVETDLLIEYLPSQLSESDLFNLFNAQNFEQIGPWMSYLQDNYVGRYDGKLASKIFKQRA